MQRLWAQVRGERREKIFSFLFLFLCCFHQQKKPIKINCSAFFTRKLTEMGGREVVCAFVDGQVLAATKTKENAGIREYALNNS